MKHRGPPFPHLVAGLVPALLLLFLTLAGCTGEPAGHPSAPGRWGKAAAPVSPAPFGSISAAALGPAPHNAASSCRRRGASPDQGPAPRTRQRSGEDPEFARKCGWPVASPPLLPGSILPQRRIVAYYGNPLSRRMGILGEVPKEEMLGRLKGEVKRWAEADPAHPVQPALHLIAVVAQGDPGGAGKYRMILPDGVVNRVYGWAREAGAILIIDIQTGLDEIRTLLPRFEWLLKNPDVHLGIDPEFNMGRSGRPPGTVIGSYDAADVNDVSGYLRDLVRRYRLPPKLLVVHRFTQRGVTNARGIVLHPEVQIIMNMDGWGPPALKRHTYKEYVVAEPVQYTGFKLFYHNDTKRGDLLMSPAALLRLSPQPLYIQYQ